MRDLDIDIRFFESLWLVLLPLHLPLDRVRGQPQPALEFVICAHDCDVMLLYVNCVLISWVGLQESDEKEWPVWEKNARDLKDFASSVTQLRLYVGIFAVFEGRAIVRRRWESGKSLRQVRSSK